MDSLVYKSQLPTGSLAIKLSRYEYSTMMIVLNMDVQVLR